MHTRIKASKFSMQCFHTDVVSKATVGGCHVSGGIPDIITAHSRIQVQETQTNQLDKTNEQTIEAACSFKPILERLLVFFFQFLSSPLDVKSLLSSGGKSHTQTHVYFSSSSSSSSGGRRLANSYSVYITATNW